MVARSYFGRTHQNMVSFFVFWKGKGYIEVVMLLAQSHLNPEFPLITEDSFARIDTKDTPNQIFEIPNINGAGVFDIALGSIITGEFEGIQNFAKRKRKLSFKIKIITNEGIFIEALNIGNNKLYKLHLDVKNKIYLIKNAYGVQKIRGVFTIESVSDIDNSVIVMQDAVPSITIGTSRNMTAVLGEEEWDVLV